MSCKRNLQIYLWLIFTDMNILWTRKNVSNLENKRAKG